MKTEYRRMPAEWEAHETWLAWPHNREDWPHGHFAPIEHNIAEFVRLLSEYEKVHLICRDRQTEKRARKLCTDLHCNLKNLHPHILKTNRCWLRDSAPTFVWRNGREPLWIAWKFNGWGECYDNYHLDKKVPEAISDWSKIPLEEAHWPDGELVVLEGGSIESNGKGMIITTEECLLKGPNFRNKGRSKREYEEMFTKSLGARKVIWLDRGFQPDQTQGHIDNVARFPHSDAILFSWTDDRADKNYKICRDNLRHLQWYQSFLGFSIVMLPLPSEPVTQRKKSLPAGYANFYIGAKTVIVPVFNDPNDYEALKILRECFFLGRKKVVGVSARNLIWGYGAFHCLAQPQFM